MKIGLALSSGGVLGAAHVGVVSQLENNNIKIDSLCGSSAGSIVGLLYSWGGLNSVNEFFSIVKDRKIFGPKNIISSRTTDKFFAQIEEILREIVKAKDFSELNIPFSCVATDYSTGNAEIFNAGDPVKCVLASSAYPGVFPLQIIGEKYYIDGGVSLNMPVSPLKKQGMDFVIASSIYSLPVVRSHSKIGRLQMLIRSLEIMENKINEYELKQANFVFKPPVGKYNWYNFSKMVEIRNAGESYALRRIKSLSLLPKEIKKIKA